MLDTPSEYGPFAPLVGYTSAIMATSGVLVTMWAGKMEKWRPPDENLPKATQSIVLLLCGVGMVLQWYFADPADLAPFLGVVAFTMLATPICYFRYSRLLGLYEYVKEVPTTSKSTRSVRILGGRSLLPAAQKLLREKAVDVQ